MKSVKYFCLNKIFLQQVSHDKIWFQQQLNMITRSNCDINTNKIKGIKIFNLFVIYKILKQSEKKRSGSQEFKKTLQGRSLKEIVYAH